MHFNGTHLCLQTPENLIVWQFKIFLRRCVVFLILPYSANSSLNVMQAQQVLHKMLRGQNLNKTGIAKSEHKFRSFQMMFSNQNHVFSKWWIRWSGSGEATKCGQFILYFYFIIIFYYYKGNSRLILYFYFIIIIIYYYKA